MKVEYINPFVTSITSVFDTMLGCSLTRGTPFLKSSPAPGHEVSGIIGLSGKAKGTVVLGLAWETARNATAAFLQEPLSEIDDDLADAIGELTNMVAGGAKAQLEQLALSVSLPSVVTGKRHVVEFPGDATPICIPFDCKWGPVSLEVGLVEQPAEIVAAQPEASGM